MIRSGDGKLLWRGRLEDRWAVQNETTREATEADLRAAGWVTLAEMQQAVCDAIDRAVDEGVMVGRALATQGPATPPSLSGKPEEQELPAPTPEKE